MFFRIQVRWIGGKPKRAWDDIRLVVFLNHTSLFEPLFLGRAPFRFLWQIAARVVAPGADITLDRPVVGTLYRMMVPEVVAISRKRDHTWDEFMRRISPHSLVFIMPEGRMKRLTGLDADGNRMSIRGGVADVLNVLYSGCMLIVYSGGLHHVQAPGEARMRIFKTIKVNLEKIEIEQYKKWIRSQGNWFKSVVISDLETRMAKYCPA